MEKYNNISEYVVDNIENAIKEGWVKVYYQPVIRSLTGALCGMESLARWIDPMKGFLPPNKFIEPLEQAQKIYILDCYVVERVCRDIHDRMEKKLPVVPVSVNFSRQDFFMCDMLDVVEKNAMKYDIPRDFIHIEITESMMVTDSQMMKKIIDSFQNAGYEVWMDDFGSGYSSLTMLKNFEFKLIKLDMDFLSDFSQKAKDIVRAMVGMAKDLDIRTLAEGVETEDEAQFLKEIGCGKIQGYYYGKPAPLNEMFRNLEEKGISIDTRGVRQFYEAACKYIRSSDVPIEIVECDGKKYRTLFMNKAYMEQIFEDYPSLEEADDRIYNTTSPLLTKYQEFVELMKKTRQEEHFYYTVGNCYLYFRAKIIAEYKGKYLLKGTITNIGTSSYIAKREELDGRIIALHHIFSVVHHIDLKNNTMTPLVGKYKYSVNHMDKSLSIQQRIQDFLEEKIFPSDKKRAEDFLNLKNLEKRLKKTESGIISDVFKVMQEDGSYTNEEILVMIIPGTHSSELLLCMKDYRDLNSNVDSWFAKKIKNADIETKEFANIFKSLVWKSNIKFFWKGLDRKYLGMSQAFLEYFGLKSMNELIGKRLSETHWYVYEEKIEEEENAVLKLGNKIVRSSRRCIINGKYKNVYVSMQPYYEKGKIVGIVGYFEDIDEIGVRDNICTQKKTMNLQNNIYDPLTGLLNVHGFMDALYDYSIRYERERLEYGLIVIKNKNHKRIIDSYGQDVCEKLVLLMTNKMQNLLDYDCVLSYSKDSIFLVLVSTDKKERLEKIARKICKAVNSIKEVEKVPVTIVMEYEYLLRSDEGVTDENIFAKIIDKFAKND